MTTFDAKTAHEELLARIEAATTTAELAEIFSTITFLDKPGLRLDLPDGDYHDGAFLATFRGGRCATTLTLGRPATGISDRIWDLWSQLEIRQQAERHAAADAQRDASDQELVRRAGRPSIGRLVQVRLPEWLIMQIDGYADANGLSRAEAARTFLIAGHGVIKAASDARRPQL